jgi:hypothetical protein
MLTTADRSCSGLKWALFMQSLLLRYVYVVSVPGQQSHVGQQSHIGQQSYIAQQSHIGQNWFKN